MGKGKRYDEPKLNMKKVFGVIITIAVIIMIIVSIKKILKHEIAPVAEIKSKYYTVYLNGKWGVINNQGQEVIPLDKDEMIVVPNKEKAIFLSIYDVNEQTGEYKTLAINEKKEQIFNEYDRVEVIENFDSKQNIWYEENILRVYKNEKYGLIDLEGKTILNCDYDEITSLKSVKENFIVRQNDKVGLVNSKGQEIIKIQYKEIKTLKEGYKNEYIIVDENDNCGVISTSGTIILEPAYKQIKYLGNAEIYAVLIDNLWTLIKKNGEVINNAYNYISVKVENVVVEKDGKYGIITTKGEEKITPTYESLEYAFSVYYIAKQEGKYGIINIDNEPIIPFEYLNMYYVEDKSILIGDITTTETVIFDNNLAQKLKGLFVFEDEYIKARIDGQNKYYNYRFEEKQNRELLTKNTLFVSEKDGKYGYLNVSGEIVVDYIYDDAKEQNEAGYAAVKKDGKWGCIDRAGKLILEPSVNLDNNLYTDFIGQWHLSNEGIYYTK
jgi:hypothetical protein